MRSLNDIGFDDDVVVKEFGRTSVICQNAADLCGSQDDSVWPAISQKGFYFRLTLKIDHIAADSNDLTIFRGETPHHRAANHTAMACNPDALVIQIIGHGSAFQTHWQVQTMRLQQSNAARCLVIGLDHFFAHLLGSDFRYPTQFVLGLTGIAQQGFYFGGPEIFRVDPDHNVTHLHIGSQITSNGHNSSDL
jgi:hypothetical protein